MSQVIIKFKSDTIKSGLMATELVNGVLGANVFDQVEQMFPGESDPELSTLYVAKTSKDRDLNNLVTQLAAADEIEYAHVPASRQF